jgi:alpha-L-fucosidase
MKRLFFILFCICITAKFGVAQVDYNRKLALPSNVQLEWQNGELTMFVHFGPATWQDREYDDLSTPLNHINPSKLNTDQWARVAKSYGAKMVIFVAKHTGGFCWWQTETTPYSIKNTPWKDGHGDVMADLSASCKKYGLRLGVYLSPEDRYLKVGMGGKAKDSTFQSAYEKIYREQLTELLTRYGQIKEIWVDGSLVFNIGDLIKRYAPNAAILQSSAATIRWVGNEHGYAPYPAWNAVKNADARSGNSTASNGDPNGDTWLPIEVDVSLRRPNWFWKFNNENAVLSLNELMKLYYLSVGRGCVFLINTSPDTTGLIPEKDVARLAEFGAEVKRRFSNPLASISGQGKMVTLKLPKLTNIDHIVAMENIKLGERVRSFKAEVEKNNGEWLTVFEGSAIGHKLIIQFPEVQGKAVRLNVKESVGEPVIKSLTVYDVKAPLITLPEVKDNWNIKVADELQVKANPDGVMNVNVDLTKFCKDAQSYEVAFVIKGDPAKAAQFSYDWSQSGLWTDNIEKGNRVTVLKSHLDFDGVNSDQYLFHDEKFQDRIHFNLTGIPPKLIINAELKIPEKFQGKTIQVYILRK